MRRWLTVCLGGNIIATSRSQPQPQPQPASSAHPPPPRPSSPPDDPCHSVGRPVKGILKKSPSDGLSAYCSPTPSRHRTLAPSPEVRTHVVLKPSQRRQVGFAIPRASFGDGGYHGEGTSGWYRYPFTSVSGQVHDGYPGGRFLVANVQQPLRRRDPLDPRHLARFRTFQHHPGRRAFPTRAGRLSHGAEGFGGCFYQVPPSGGVFPHHAGRLRRTGHCPSAGPFRSPVPWLPNSHSNRHPQRAGHHGEYPVKRQVVPAFSSWERRGWEVGPFGHPGTHREYPGTHREYPGTHREYPERRSFCVPFYHSRQHSRQFRGQLQPQAVPQWRCQAPRRRHVSVQTPLTRPCISPSRWHDSSRPLAASSGSLYCHSLWSGHGGLVRGQYSSVFYRPRREEDRRLEGYLTQSQFVEPSFTGELAQFSSGSRHLPSIGHNVDQQDRHRWSSSYRCDQPPDSVSPRNVQPRHVQVDNRLRNYTSYIRAAAAYLRWHQRTQADPGHSERSQAPVRTHLSPRSSQRIPGQARERLGGRQRSAQAVSQNYTEAHGRRPLLPRSLPSQRHDSETLRSQTPLNTSVNRCPTLGRFLTLDDQRNARGCSGPIRTNRGSPASERHVEAHGQGPFLPYNQPVEPHNENRALVPVNSSVDRPSVHGRFLALPPLDDQRVCSGLDRAERRHPASGRPAELLERRPFLPSSPPSGQHNGHLRAEAAVSSSANRFSTLERFLVLPPLGNQRNARGCGERGSPASQPQAEPGGKRPLLSSGQPSAPHNDSVQLHTGARAVKSPVRRLRTLGRFLVLPPLTDKQIARAHSAPVGGRSAPVGGERGTPVPWGWSSPPAKRRRCLLPSPSDRDCMGVQASVLNRACYGVEDGGDGDSNQVMSDIRQRRALLDRRQRLSWIDIQVNGCSRCVACVGVCVRPNAAAIESQNPNKAVLVTSMHSSTHLGPGSRHVSNGLTDTRRATKVFGTKLRGHVGFVGCFCW